CFRINIGKDRSSPGAKDGTGGRKEAEGRSDHGIAALDTGGGQDKPERVGTGGTSYRLAGRAQNGGFLLEVSYLRPQAIAFRIAHPRNRRQDFLANRGVLARQVQHGNVGNRFLTGTFHRNPSQILTSGCPPAEISSGSA